MHTQRLRFALPLGFVTLLLGAWKLSPAQDVTMVAEHVAGPVYMVTGQGGNLGVSVGPDGLLLIDDQFERLAPKIKGALAELAKGAELESGDPRFLVNTHFHGDHTGGNAVFGEVATIIAHENVRKRLVSPKSGDAMAKAGLPVITYADGLSVHFNGEEIRLLHLQASHTDGDTVVYFTGSNVVHMGDMGFNRAFPFIDLDGGGSVDGYIANLQHLLDTTDAQTRFIPGHGALATRADVEAMRATLIDVRDLVKAALAEGKTTPEMVSAGLLSKYESWGQGFINQERMITILVRSMTDTETEQN